MPALNLSRSSFSSLICLPKQMYILCSLYRLTNNDALVVIKLCVCVRARDRDIL